MKGYYLYNTEYDFREPGRKLTGVERKVLAQIKTFNEEGLPCELLLSIHKIGNVWKKIASRMPFGTDNVVYPPVSKAAGADWLYIRKPFLIGYSFRHYLREVRRQNPNIKILLEIPTWPYDEELERAGWQYYPILWRERFNRKRIRREVDRLVMINPEDKDLKELRGTPVLPVINGIRLKDVPVREPQSGNSVIRAFCPANFTVDQAIDRFLNGMALYYQNGGKEEIQLYLAGDGEALPGLKEIVDRDETLQRRIHFLGFLSGEEMESYYSLCDVGIVSFGVHRQAPEGRVLSSALKTRDFLAKGLPFIGDMVDVFAKEPARFFLETPHGEEPVQMEPLIDFYHTLYPQGTVEEKKQLAEEMRAYAQRTVEMNIAMKSVIDYLKEAQPETAADK